MDRFEDIAISRPQDRKYYSEESEDPAIRTEFEGGFVSSRARHKRSPLRRTYTTGFTDISNTEKLALQAFWVAQKGGSKIFEWFDPFAHATVAYETSTSPGSLSRTAFRRKVRFVGGSMKFTPAGYGPLLRWDVAGIKMEEA